MKNKFSLFILVFFLCVTTFGQINNYRYQRTITGIKDQWHKIELPVEIFSKLKPDFSDIRIIGFTKENDTLEVPYILNEGSEKISATKMDFSLLNQSIKDETTKTLVSEEKALKQTIIDIDLHLPVPVSMLTLFIKDTIDFYRPITIKYLQDSTKSQDGWNYIYSTVQEGTLNSFEKNKFYLNNIVLKKIKLIIENDDNRPLQIDSVRIEGSIYSLEARFDKPAEYFLLYGNTGAIKPKYDITRFTEKIPSTSTVVVLGDEESKNKIGISEKVPLFENKMWLWLIMTITIIILGWFSFKMMQEKK